MMKMMKMMMVMMMMMVVAMPPPPLYGKRQQYVDEPVGEAMALPFERRLRIWMTWP
jgi:hypothetical protein